MGGEPMSAEAIEKYEMEVKRRKEAQDKRMAEEWASRVVRAEKAELARLLAEVQNEEDAARAKERRRLRIEELSEKYNAGRDSAGGR